MILLTVGTQLPFDRLVRAVDQWCESTGRRDVFAQVGDLSANSYYPRHMSWQRFVEPLAFEKLLNDAEVMIAHAGMGSIISALTRDKTILVMPRRASLGEHRNDHQLSTADRFAGRERVFVCTDESDFAKVVQDSLADSKLLREVGASLAASPELIRSLREFILKPG